MGGRYDAVHLHPVVKAGPKAGVGFNGAQEIAGLDDDLVLIAGAVAGALAEGQVIGMLWPHQDLAKPAQRGRVFGTIEPKRILVFLVKADGTFCACDFIGIAHFSPHGDAAERQMPHRAIVKAADELADVVIHRAALRMKGVKMLGGVSYERIDAHGLHISHGEARERPELIEADTIVLCAGQLSERSLADALAAEGVEPIIIGGADVAAELDAKRAIDQGTRVAAAL